jgi:hypothetical protein
MWRNSRPRHRFLPTASRIAARTGLYHMCALAAGGVAYCWLIEATPSKVSTELWFAGLASLAGKEVHNGIGAELRREQELVHLFIYRRGDSAVADIRATRAACKEGRPR